MMKKTLTTFILLISIIMTGCTVGKMEQEKESNAMLEKYLTHLDFLQTPVREYGEGTAYIQMEEKLMVRIMYPEGEIASLHEAIENWVQETVMYYEEESADIPQGQENAELTADYNSYVRGDLVSVEIRGIYEKPYNAHPIDLVATFHASRTTGEKVSLEDIVTEEGLDFLWEKVINDAGVDPDVVDEFMLDHWKVSNDGLEIILERGAYLPMSDGTVTLLYTYDELERYLKPQGQAGEPIENIQLQPQGQEQYEALPESDIVNVEDGARPMIALTFDDGPGKYTERLLDVLAVYDVKATFFVVGNLVDNGRDTLQRMAKEGHQIAGHSWDHRQLTKLTSKDLTDQIMNTRAKIYDITNVDATVIRPPYGAYNDDVKGVCEGLGIALVNWSVDTLDWKNKNADMVYDAIMTEANEGDIILCHDLYSTTVDAIEMAIPALIEAGYRLVTVEELLSEGGQAIEAGKVYNRR